MVDKRRRQKLMEALEKRLEREITNFKTTLVSIDGDKTKSMDSISEYNKRISDVLTEISNNNFDPENFFYNTAITDVLSVGPLKRTEIPLSILHMLIAAGFGVNNYQFLKHQACLDLAVENHHYSAVRFLLKHGGWSCNDIIKGRARGYLGSDSFLKPVIVSLASHPNVPLDLFDVLVTPHSLNDCSQCKYLSLHEAVFKGCTKNAQHLIKLGASVDQQDGFSILPIEYYLEKHTEESKDELFSILLPKRAHGVDTFRPICKIMTLEIGPEILLEMLHQLLQRLHFKESLSVQITRNDFRPNYMTINEVVVTPGSESFYTVSNLASTRGRVHFCKYLCSLILIELKFDMFSTPSTIADKLSRSTDEAYVRATDDVWRKFHQQCRVKMLLRLCILCIRNSMCSLDDESFLSLPVPPRIRRLLTYRYVAEVVYEECEEYEEYYVALLY